MLVENPSCYIGYSQGEMDEGIFLSELARRTGCGILCDVNNIFVTASNRGTSPHDLLSRFARSAVKQIHIAGHATEEDENGMVLVDTHDRRPCDEVLALYATAMEKFDDVPALVEWDSQLPELSVLLDEAARVQTHVRLSPRMLTLENAQIRMRDALLSKEPAPLGDLFGQTAPRFEIYRRHFIHSITASLEKTFPAVVNLVDERFFAFAADCFIRAHPPTSPCLFEYGGEDEHE